MKRFHASSPLLALMAFILVAGCDVSAGIPDDLCNEPVVFSAVTLEMEVDGLNYEPTSSHTISCKPNDDLTAYSWHGDEGVAAIGIVRLGPRSDVADWLEIQRDRLERDGATLMPGSNAQIQVHDLNNMRIILTMSDGQGITEAQIYAAAKGWRRPPRSGAVQ